jgi:hypothetical protein
MLAGEVSIAVFELACVVVVIATIAVMARTRDPRVLVLDYLALAVAGYLGEQSCISFYEFYSYARGWHVFVGSVPLLVPLIWPLVILSARDVARALSPKDASRLRVALLVFAIVTLDASLVEVVAVRARLWSWAERGHLAVPLVGILGWGFFAFGVTLPARRIVAMVTGLATTHAMILASWWGFFRWTARGELGLLGFAPLGALAAAAVAFAIGARRAGRPMSPEVWIPRALAAGLFFVLLAVTAPRDGGLLAHTACVAVPYLLATSIRRTRSPAAPRAATAPSRPGTGSASPSPGA